MSRPTNVGILGERWYGELEPLTFAEELYDYPLLRWVGALGEMIEPLSALVSQDEGGRPGWSALFDPDRCPAALLPWLGQLRGVRLTAGITQTQQRDEIRNPAPDVRGTPQALIAAGKKHLTGTKYLNLTELVSADYNQALVTTRTAETPDAAQTLRDLVSQQRVGLKLVHVVTSVTLIDELVDTIDAQAGTIDAL